MRYEVDFLVIGSGIAGLSFALKVAPYGKVCILTKSVAAEGSTRYAQGGIAAVMYDDDSFDKHIQDTLVAGDGICDREVVEMTIREAPERIAELVQYGVNFDMEKGSGRFDLHREGGHSEFRILHHKDNTGEEIERGLLQAIHDHPNIELKEHQFAIDIITQHHLGQRVTKHTPDIECYGVYALDTETNRIDTYLAKVTLLATGGMGNVYSTTTTPIISTGDGVAMVHRARGVLKDLEFMQFHPTSLYNPAEKPAFLITEAMRGAGAILKDRDGKEFMQKYDKRLSLAPRDIVARAIDNEMKLSGKDYLYLDARGIGKKHLIEGFPTIYAKCLSIGIDITRDMIPIRPAAHYQCGGIKVDRNGESSIHHLYAAGECSCTGLHGGNRLASNSLLEAVVYAHNAAMSAINLITQNTPSTSNTRNTLNDKIPDWNAEGMVLNEEMVLITQTKKELQEIMTNYVGIVRSDLRLRRAFDRLNLIFRETEELYNRSVLTEPLCELRNLIACAYLIIKQAMARRQNVGLHYSIDLTRENGDAHEDVGVPARAENESASSKEQTIKVNSFSDAELDDAMRLMASNRGKDDQPKVGIFWYDTRHKELFGIRSHLVTDYLKPNSRSEFESVSCSEMHEDVWKKEFNKQRYKNGGIGPFVGPYEMTPRGRIFYNPSSDEYTIAVGSWINEHPKAVQLIVDEFNLGNTKYSVKAAQHWDVGQKWM